MAGHEHFARMAVGHVLGGLDEVDAAAFRAHLLDCPDCRKRVNELRDIASDLARTEREERRAASAGVVEVETRTDQDTPEATEVAPVRQWPWGVVVIGLVPLLVLGMLAWAVWQRAQTDITAAVAESQQRVLDVLASGEPVEWSSPESVEGNVATDGEDVVVNLAGLPELEADQGVVVWLVDDEGDAVANTLPFLRSQVAGTLVATLPHTADASEVVVSIETDLPELTYTRPSGYPIVTGTLPDVAAASGG